MPVPVERGHPIRAKARHHFVHESLTGRVHDAHAGVLVQQGSSDRVHEVGLAHAHSAVDEQWDCSYGRDDSTLPLQAACANSLQDPTTEVLEIGNFGFKEPAVEANTGSP